MRFYSWADLANFGTITRRNFEIWTIPGGIQEGTIVFEKINRGFLRMDIIANLKS